MDSRPISAVSLNKKRAPSRGGLGVGGGK